MRMIGVRSDAAESWSNSTEVDQFVARRAIGRRGEEPRHQHFARRRARHRDRRRRGEGAAVEDREPRGAGGAERLRRTERPPASGGPAVLTAMAKYDVFANPQGEGYLLDVQADLLEDLS